MAFKKIFLRLQKVLKVVVVFIIKSSIVLILMSVLIFFSIDIPARSLMPFLSDFFILSILPLCQASNEWYSKFLSLGISLCEDVGVEIDGFDLESLVVLHDANKIKLIELYNIVPRRKNHDTSLPLAQITRNFNELKPRPRGL